MANSEPNRFENLLKATSAAFNQSGQAEQPDIDADNQPKMVNNRQSVYKVPLMMVRPDRFQARFMLPHALREPFFRGENDWRKTVALWLAMAENDRLVKRELDELIALGDSLADLGQIKPITGQVVTLNGRDTFLLLTGERRFWATALKAYRENRQDEPMVLALLDSAPSLEKQIAENMAYKELTPVGKARAAARLVLEANKLTPNLEADELDYFRQVSELRLSDETRALLEKNLKMERTYFGRLMRFFELPGELLEVCDRSEMPERVLREMMAFDRKYWPQAVRYYAEHEGRTYLDMHAYLERLQGTAQERKPRIPADPATKSARTLRRVLLGVDDLPQEDKLGSLADAVVGDADKDEARKVLARLEGLTAAVRQRVEGMK
ncbi:MAG: hypothetical protein GXY37_03315 [Chloroflexi bacterium]|nr:hypothetical protein [Chloroflexota bacterium]